MQDAEVLLSLSQMAGVFVGFAALISVRSTGPNEAREITFIRSVVWAGLWVVVAGIAPVMISRYGITGHELWAGCSLVVMALLWTMILLQRRALEHRVEAARHTERIRPAFVYSVFMLTASVALSIVAIGLVPDLEPALYVTAVALILFFDALLLWQLVMSQGRVQRV